MQQELKRIKSAAVNLFSRMPSEIKETTQQMLVRRRKRKNKIPRFLFSPRLFFSRFNETLSVSTRSIWKSKGKP
jgi:hypothetical protein